MKFKEKYPNMAPIHEEIGGIVKGSKSLPCHICKENTDYVEINYEAAFCSEECVKELDKFIMSQPDLEPGDYLDPDDGYWDELHDTD